MTGTRTDTMSGTGRGAVGGVGVRVRWGRAMLGMRAMLGTLGMLAGLAALPMPVAAQEVILRGRVTTADGLPLEDVRVRPERGRGRARTDARGEYLLTEGLSPESTVVLFARIGQEPVAASITLRPGENRLDIVMQPFVQRVDTVTVVGVQRGLFGIVVDTAAQRVAGARVRLLGGNGQAVTDEEGRFAFPDARLGGVAIEVTKAGLAPRLLSATVPPRGAARVVVWMRGFDALEARRKGSDKLPPFVVQETFDQGFRRGMVRGPWALVTREQIALQQLAGAVTLGDALRQAPTSITRGVLTQDPSLRIPFQRVPCLFVDGRWSVAPTLDDFLAQDVEMVELYMGSRRPGTMQGGSSVCVRVILRQG